MVAAIRAHAEQHGPPGSVGRLHEVGMPHADDVHVPSQVAVRQHGVGPVADVRAGHRVRPGHGDRVVELGAALSGEQVVRPVHPVEVRPLGPHRAQHGAPPQHVLRSGQPHRGGVQLAQPDLGLVVPLGLAGEAGAVQPDPAVVVEEQGRVDAVLAQPHRVGPRPRRIGRGEHEVAAARAVLLVHERADQPERPVVVPQGRRVEPTRRCDALHVELPRPVHRVTNLLPVHQVTAAEHR